jgi:hypothetical protein
MQSGNTRNASPQNSKLTPQQHYKEDAVIERVGTHPMGACEHASNENTSIASYNLVCSKTKKTLEPNAGVGHSSRCVNTRSSTTQTGPVRRLEPHWNRPSPFPVVSTSVRPSATCEPTADAAAWDLPSDVESLAVGPATRFAVAMDDGGIAVVFDAAQGARARRLNCSA